MTNPMAAAVEAALQKAMAAHIHKRMELYGRGATDSCSTEEACWAAAIAAYESRMAEAGWVMVPKTATDAIAFAGRDELVSEIASPSATLMALAYDAMVRAAMPGRDDPPRADGEG